MKKTIKILAVITILLFILSMFFQINSLRNYKAAALKYEAVLDSIFKSTPQLKKKNKQR